VHLTPAAAAAGITSSSVRFHFPGVYRGWTDTRNVVMVMAQNWFHRLSSVARLKRKNCLLYFNTCTYKTHLI